MCDSLSRVATRWCYGRGTRPCHGCATAVGLLPCRPSVSHHWQPHTFDSTDYPACGSAYGALIQACEQARWTPTASPGRFPVVETAACSFARCAREEGMRAPVVLEQLRSALRALTETSGMDVSEIVRLAAAAYYERRPDA